MVTYYSLIDYRNEKHTMFRKRLDGKAPFTRDFVLGDIAVSEENESLGIVEGYAVTWNYRDSYKSYFTKGAFTQSLQEKLQRNMIKILDQHLPQYPIGLPLDIREDEKGLFVRFKLNLEIQRARDTFSNIKHKVINGLSFGFDIPPGGYRMVNGEMEINKVDLFEISPVTFPASDQALIENQRGYNFDENHEEKNRRNEFWRLVSTLDETIFDIFDGYYYNDLDSNEFLSLMHDALDDFNERVKSAIIDWTELNEQTRETETGKITYIDLGRFIRENENADKQAINASSRFCDYCRSFDDDNALYSETDFTKTEINDLCNFKRVTQSIMIPKIRQKIRDNLPAELAREVLFKEPEKEPEKEQSKKRRHNSYATELQLANLIRNFQIND